jgi:hypothetical protein
MKPKLFAASVCFLLLAASQVLASDGPYGPSSPAGVALVYACLPALLIVPVVVVRLLFRLISHEWEEAKRLNPWWWVVLAVSLVPWLIVSVWLAVWWLSR